MILNGADWISLMKIVNPIDVILFIATVFFTMYLYILTRKEKRPCYVMRSVKNIPLSHQGIEIENLTITKALFWNDGRDTIRFEDIAQADPLRFTIEENGNILDAKIIQVRTEANQFQINVSENNLCAVVSFDFIDKDEGAVFQLLHTGKSFRDIKFTGRIKGGGTPSRKISFLERTSSIMWKNMMWKMIEKQEKRKKFSFGFRDFVTLMAIARFLIWSVAGFMILSSFFVGISYWGGPLSFSFGVVFYICLGFLYGGRKFPKGFDAYEEDL